MDIVFDPELPSSEYSLDDLIGLASHAGEAYANVINSVMDEQHLACEDKVRGVAYAYVLDLNNRGLLSRCPSMYEEEMSDLVLRIMQCGGDPEVAFNKAMNYE